MKSFYYTCLFCCAASVVSTVSAQNLYDLAAPVGLQTSLPLKWDASVKVGYDDNVNATSRHSANHQSSAFTSVDVGASMADMDARTQLAFNARLGAIFYLDKMRFGSNQVVSNTSLSSTLSHVFDPTLRYNATLNLAYQPEPDYQSGVSSPRRMGDYLQVYFNNSISKAWDSRFSTITGFNISMIDYQEAYASIEDSTHYGLSNVFRFKWTTRAALLLEWRGTYTDRKYGYDAFSNFILTGFEYALDKYTNASLKFGPQFKHITGRGTNTTFSFEGAVDRVLTNRASCGIFVRLADESTQTYSFGQSYEKNMSFRAGLRGSYKISPKLTLSGTVNLINSDFSRGSGIYTPDRTETTWNCSASLTAKLTKDWSANATYAFTNGQYSGGLNRPSYVRNVFSVGTTRTF